MNRFIDWLYSSPLNLLLVVGGLPLTFAIAEMIIHEFVCTGYHFLIICKIS